MEFEIAVTSLLPGRAVAMLEEKHEVRVHSGEALTGEDELAAFIGSADAVLTLLQNPVTERVLRACPNLKVVGNCAVGFDNVDLEASRRHGLWVTNTPDVLTEATADLTWALILAVTRRVGEAERFLRAGGFDGWTLDMLLGSAIQKKQLGIIGCGRIGRAVARRASCFGMSVAFNGGSAPGATSMELDELLAASHVVSVHAPLSDGTRHLLDERRLRLMPEGAFLINTARGPIIDEAALVKVLLDGHLGGAGLDVFENEPTIHPGLMEREDVVLLPHIGSATVETRSAMAELAAANILAVLSGGDPPTPVVCGEV